MTDPAAPSPKRRHILSSINPHDQREPVEVPQPSRGKYDEGEGATDNGDDLVAAHQDDAREADETPGRDKRDEESRTLPRRSRLKLKSEKSRHRRKHRHGEDNRDSDVPDGGSKSRHDDRHHRHGRRKRRRRHGERSPSPPNPHDPPPLDPEAAFRESLFDAMADDEGASYWESVYGQPIHVYSSDKVGAAGELEQMTEEEYAAHVRQKMWEKTHAGLLEERARREARRKQKKEEEERTRELQREMKQSLRRGEERRREKRWAAQWNEYVRAWATWNGTVETLAWPVDGHGRRDVCEKEVRSFYVHGLDVERVGEREFLRKLKEERVRWHPDKMQQRLGGSVDGDVMRDVTAVFQIIDKLWTDTRGTA